MSAHGVKIVARHHLPSPRPPGDTMIPTEGAVARAPRRRRVLLLQAALVVAVVAMTTSGPGVATGPSAPPAVQTPVTPADVLPVGPIMRAVFR